MCIVSMYINIEKVVLLLGIGHPSWPKPETLLLCIHSKKSLVRPRRKISEMSFFIQLGTECRPRPHYCQESRISCAFLPSLVDTGGQYLHSSRLYW